MLTHDEAPRIAGALASAPGGAARLVVDAQSSDDTVAIAARMGARVIVRAWTNFVDARRFAISQVQTPWVLMLDADEVLDDVLVRSIFACDGSDAGYVVHRTTYFCGRPMRLWEGEPLIRLFRRDCASVATRPSTGSASLHEHILVRGSVGRLDGTMRHDSYPTVGSYWQKFRRYTAIEARGASRSPLRALFATALVPVRLLRSLIGRRAILDGWRGVLAAYGSALYPAAVAWRAWLR